MKETHMEKWMTLILSAVLLAGCTAEQPEPETREEEPVEIIEMKGSEPGGQKYQAVIKVKDYGDIVFEMDEGIAPETVKNFVKLAQDGFYDGLTFHRLIEGFMAQGGDPNADGTGGADEEIEGEFLSNGFNNTLKHVRGTVSMARSSDPDSASSQFFIVQEDAPSLDGEYAAFGTVTSGMDVVDKILKDAEPEDGNGTIDRNEQPVIESITVTKED